ncbi:MAG: ribosome maturation protein RimP [Janthinobacterium lividum]
MADAVAKDWDALERVIAPEAEALGFALVRVRLFGGKSDPTLQVMAERPDTRQLTIDDCAELSRRISDRLDEADAAGRDLIDEAYRLEVSSPGIDRPLTRRQDYADWAGHEARLVLAEPIEGRKQLTGDLIGIVGETVGIDVRKHGAMNVSFDKIADAKLLLTDRLIAATRPLSLEGADEYEDDEGADEHDADHDHAAADDAGHPHQAAPTGAGHEELN